MALFSPINGHADLVKDESTGMIININKSKADQVRARRARATAEREEIEALKSDVQDIKIMLKQLLENGANG
jgi:hypothetical protein